MVIEIKNKQILSFFEQHPCLDPEITILKFINIMETLNENMNKTLNNTTVLEILDNIKSLRQDNVNLVSSAMIQIKQGLNEDIRMIMCNSMNKKFEKSGDRILDFKCSTKNCECVICNNCVVNIYDNQSDNEYFKCPLCRQICYKEYFSTVVLGMEFKNKMEEKKQKLIWKVDFLKEERDRINRELLYLERLINF